MDSLFANFGINLPNQQAEREEFVSRIEGTIAELCRYSDREPAQIRIFDQHTYTQIDDRCPKCNAYLVFPHLDPDIDAWAYARVSCRECSWSGRAVYTLIDYHEDLTVDNPVNEAVRKYDLEPSYFSL